MLGGASPTSLSTGDGGFTQTVTTTVALRNVPEDGGVTIETSDSASDTDSASINVPASSDGCQAGPPAYAVTWDGEYDFSLGTTGPRHVVQGYDLYIQIESELLGGTRDLVYYNTLYLPEGASATYPKLEEECCGGNRGWKPKNTLLKISTRLTTPAGTYPIVVRMTSGGVTHETCHTIYVDPPPTPLAMIPVVDVPPIPESVLKEWEQNMTEKGQRYCEPILEVSEGFVWYYDGIRVYYQIAEYTNDRSWLACAEYSKDFYLRYIFERRVQGWRVFPHGLQMDYLHTGDPESKTGAILLSTDSAFAKVGGAVYPNRMRETAYLIHAYRIAKALGEPVHPRYARAVDFALGHIDQSFVSKTEPWLKPFMVGLLSEALIQYYEETKDPRVPPAIKAAMDGLWERAWVAEDKAFFYQSTKNTSEGAPDLNLLIAPAFAWLYRMTGDPVYQQRGDLVLEGGVRGAYLGAGKHFSQNYRWSMDYVKWRLSPIPASAAKP